MLKKLPFRVKFEEGPYELEISKRLSTEPFPPTLDAIRLPNDPPIILQPLLHPFYNPPFELLGSLLPLPKYVR